MRDGFFIFFLVNMLVAYLLTCRASWLSYRLFQYIQQHYPGKLEQLNCTFATGKCSIRWPRGLYKKHDIDDDPVFLRLKTKARNALTCGVLAWLPISLFMILILVIVLVSG